MKFKFIVLIFIILSEVIYAQGIESKIEKIVDIQTGNYSKDFQKVYYSQVISTLLPKEIASNDSLSIAFEKIYLDEMKKLSGNMKNTYLKIYRENLTDEEITFYYNFLTSKEGNSIISKIPIIMNDAMVIIKEKYLTDNFNRIRNRFNEYYKNYKSKVKPIEEGVAPPPPPHLPKAE